MIEIRYRDDEAIYIKPETDRAIIIFNVQFKDSDDVVFAKFFLQEYQDTRKTMSNAPAVSYSQKVFVDFHFRDSVFILILGTTIGIKGC